MKIHFGKYTTWIGPYQIADLLKYIGVSEDTRDVLGNYLRKTWVYKVCNWVEEKKKRKIKIKIHDYDLWNLDHTLGLIILESLKKFRELDLSFVPVGPNTGFLPDDEEAANKLSESWKSELDKMIWSFEQITGEEKDFWIEHPVWDESEDSIFKVEKEGTFDTEGHRTYQKAIQEGLILFGEKFRFLHD
jgi:hypothetical protein